MHPNVFTLLVAGASALVGASGLAAWFKLGRERKKISAETEYTDAETQSRVYANLERDYRRVCDDLGQLEMRLRACKQENEACRKQVQELRDEVSGTHRQFLLARARGHAAGKLAGNYVLHNESVLDVIREHNKKHPHHEIPITPMMRAVRLQETYQTELSRLDDMEAQDLELLIRKETPNK